MKILVCISCVPDTTSKISFTDGDTKFNKDGVQFVIGPYDEYALSKAVDLQASGATVTVLNVGGAETEPVIRKALAVGANDAIRINAEPTDAMLIAKEIANVAKDGNYDMILMGRETTDYNGGQIHGMVGEILGLPSISPVMKMDIEGNTATLSREIEGGKETLKVNTPFVAGCQEPIAEWKIPNMRGIMSARTKPLQVIEPSSATASTSVSSFAMPPAKSECKLIDADNVQELVDLLRNEAKVI